MSLCACDGVYASLTAPLIAPLDAPAGENQENELIDVLAINPPISPFSGMYLNSLLNLSNVYL